LLAFGIGLVGCDTGTNGGSNGGGSSNSIVGKYYDTQEHANAGGKTGLQVEFQSDGKFISYDDNGNNDGTVATWKTSGNKLTITVQSPFGPLPFTADFVVNGTALTLSNASTFMGNEAIPNGTAYKK
jgi:hypothetical protein